MQQFIGHRPVVTLSDLGTHLAAVLVLVLASAVACDRADGRDDPSEPVVQASRGSGAGIPEPNASAGDDQHANEHGTTTPVRSAPPTEVRSTASSRAEAAAVAGVAVVLGAAVQPLTVLANVPAETTNPSLLTNSAPPRGARRGTRAKQRPKRSSGGVPCEAATFAWGSIRVSTAVGTSKLKNGAYDSFDEEDGCLSVQMIGPAIADLDLDGIDEAYFVINELVAPPDLSDAEDAVCAFGMMSTDETLYSYRLDDDCKPVALTKGIPTRECPGNDECAPLKLHVRGNQIVYGDDRFVWSDGKLIAIR